MGNETFGNRTEEALGRALYGTGEARTEEPTQEGGGLHGLKGLAQDEALGNALYPPQNDNIARVMDNQKVEALIRSRDGKIVHRGGSDSREALATRENAYLVNADLSQMDFTAPGTTLQDGNIRRSDCRGTKLGNLRYCNIADIEIDESTDIGSADFFMCEGMTEELYSRLRNCRGFETARNLFRPRV